MLHRCSFRHLAGFLHLQSTPWPCLVRRRTQKGDPNLENCPFVSCTPASDRQMSTGGAFTFPEDACGFCELESDPACVFDFHKAFEDTLERCLSACCAEIAVHLSDPLSRTLGVRCAAGSWPAVFSNFKAFSKVVRMPVSLQQRKVEVVAVTTITTTTNYYCYYYYCYYYYYSSSYYYYYYYYYYY